MLLLLLLQQFDQFARGLQLAVTLSLSQSPQHINSHDGAQIEQIKHAHTHKQLPDQYLVKGLLLIYICQPFLSLSKAKQTHTRAEASR